IAARLWHNLPICAEFAEGGRMRKAFKFIIKRLRFHYAIAARLWHNLPICAEFAEGERMRKAF
ncbi:MAG: hypothetical protein ACLVFU_10080, partial [Eggerthellaceae bacterium]